MKKVNFWIGSKAGGFYEDVIFMSDSATDEEINAKIDELSGFSKGFVAENGYHSELVETYIKD